MRSAVLRTRHGVAADEWYVDSPSGEVPDPDRLVRGLIRLGHGDHGPLASLEDAPPRARRPRFGPGCQHPGYQQLPGQARALVVPPGASQTATVVEVRASDRPGLLYDIGTALSRAGVSVRSAHIATYAGQALDTFYLTPRRRGRALAEVRAVVGLLIATCDDAPTGSGGGASAAFR